MEAVRRDAFRASSTCQPVMPGMARSRRMRSGGRDADHHDRVRAVGGRETSAPASVSATCSTPRIDAWSSTTRMRRPARGRSASALL